MDKDPYDELDEVLEPLVSEVNEMVESLQMDGDNVDFISAADIFLPMAEALMAKHSTSTLTEMLCASNPHLAIELGLITRREAILEGIFPLNKSHVLEGYIDLSEIPRDVLKKLNFSAEELKQLKGG